MSIIKKLLNSNLKDNNLRVEKEQVSGVSPHIHQLKNFITPKAKNVQFHMKLSIFSFWGYLHLLA